MCTGVCVGVCVCVGVWACVDLGDRLRWCVHGLQLLVRSWCAYFI